jgi:hypothetical protein
MSVSKKYNKRGNSNSEVKTFDKMFQEFLVEYNQAFNSCIRMSIKDINEVVFFYNELVKHLDLLEERDTSLFNKISLFKQINLHNKVLNATNGSIIWKYILQLLIVSYTIVDKNKKYIKDTEIFKTILNKWNETESIESLKTIHSTIDSFVPETNSFNNVIKNIATKVNSAMASKDISSLEEMDPHDLQEKLIKFLDTDTQEKVEESTSKEVDSSKVEEISTEAIENIIPSMENILPGIGEMFPGFDFGKTVAKIAKNKDKNGLNNMFNELIPGLNLSEMINDIASSIKDSLNNGNITENDCNEIKKLFTKE